MLGDWQLARICIGMPSEPIDEVAFARALDARIATALASKGHVWTRERRDGELQHGWRVVDLSVWQDLAALDAYLEQSRVAELMTRFHMLRSHGPSALFWVPAGYRPDFAEAHVAWDAVVNARDRYSAFPAFPPERPEPPPAQRPYLTHAGYWTHAAPEDPWIERSPTSRERCATCEATIAKGEVRVTETRVDARGATTPRAYHLACAIDARPRLVQDLLGSRVIDPALILDVRPLYEQINARIAVLDAAQRAEHDARLAGVAVAPAAGDPLVEPLLAQLEDAPDDRGVLGVLADVLIQRGDPRGELIATQLALAGRDDPQLLGRRDELRAQLAPPLPPTEPGNNVIWGIGYVARLELGERTSARIALLGALWKHPSLRVLQHLTTGGQNATAALHAGGPRTLRRLELVRDQPLGAIDALVAELPRLESLRLHGRTAARTLAHPRLTSLSLRGQATLLARDLEPAAVPALARLELHLDARTDPADLLAPLADPRWDGRALTIVLAGTLELEHAGALRERIAPRRLAHLDVTGCELDGAILGVLRDICTELTAAARPLGDRLRHRNKPEWGVGTVRRRFENKVEVEFPGAGVKVFRTDAPFLEPA